MLTKLIFFILLATQLYASNILNNTYYVNSNDINITSIIPHAKSNFELFKIAQGKYSKRVKSKDLLKILKLHGYSNYKSKSRYIKFIKKSPIDTTKIKLNIKKYYKKKYEQIDIQKIEIESRGYLASLPKEYIVEIRDRNFLSKSGTLSIKTPQNKKIFFNYTIKANISVYETRKKIKKSVELSAFNTIKKSIILDKFRAKPIQNIKKGTLQTKRHIKQDKIITIRDIEKLSLVKKNSYINVSLKSDNMAITFSAKALQDGKLNDIIRVQKSNGKRLKVKITGKNRAEIR